jgi:hypothetical protein
MVHSTVNAPSWVHRMASQEHMSHRGRRKSVQLPCTSGCHRNTNSGIKLSIFGNCASIGNARAPGHRYARIASPTSARGFVFRWHQSYTLLCRLRRLIIMLLPQYIENILDHPIIVQVLAGARRLLASLLAPADTCTIYMIG